ncbi:MAG TPA: flagellar basal body-associated FliL family protein [Bacteroidota bacterium]|nr:flagellar basal body-associated FliL family protein [Bacteroidota bacterium]
MAKEQQPPEAAKPAAPAPAAQGITPMKLVIIGVPLFLVQLAVVYFLVAKFVAPASTPAGPQTRAAEPKETAEAKSIFVVKDVIVNPAGTNGTRFLLTTVGFEINGIEREKELEGKEVQVRDVLNTILTSKGLEDLSGNEQREALRKEILQKVGEMLPAGSLTNVYFSKFIIQ